MSRLPSGSSRAAGLFFLWSTAIATSITACGANMPPVEQPPAASLEDLQKPLFTPDASVRD
jgi:hypothetical protein